jgi:acyl carrier protein
MADAALVADIIRSIRKVTHLPATTIVRPESRLVEDLGIDSLDLVGIYLGIQDEFGVIIDENDLPRLVRIADLAAYVEQARSASAA